MTCLSCDHLYVTHGTDTRTFHCGVSLIDSFYVHDLASLAAVEVAITFGESCPRYVSSDFTHVEIDAMRAMRALYSETPEHARGGVR